MIGSGATDELVWIDKDSHECYVLVNASERHNRPIPGYMQITQLCNPNLRWFIENIHSNRFDLQMKYIFLLARKLSPIPDTDEEGIIPPEETVLADIESYRFELLRMLEYMEENELKIDGKFIGYSGMLKIRGDRVVQYNHYGNLLPQMPPSTLVLRKMLEFYLEMYPLRVEHKSRIKDFVAERSDLYVGMDSDFKVVMDVVLLPLIMKNDDDNLMDISVPIELSPFGTEIAGRRIEQYLTADMVDTASPPPALCMSEFSIKELRGLLIIIFEICFERDRCPKIVEFGNTIYSLVVGGLSISRRKIEVLIGSHGLTVQTLVVEILEVILDSKISTEDFSDRVRKMIEVVRRHEQGQ